MLMMTANIINFDYLFDSVDQNVKHLLEQMVILFSGKKIRPCTYALLKLKRLGINLLPKCLFFHLFHFKKSPIFLKIFCPWL